MEDPEFFYYAKFFLRIHGFSLETNGNNFAYRFWAILNSTLQEIMLFTLIYNTYNKHPDIALMVSCSTVAFGVFVNSFKIMSIQRNIERLSDFYHRLIEFWTIPEKPERKILLQHKNFTNIVSVVNCLSLIGGISWWLLLPPALSAYEEFTFGNTTWIPPYNITYIDFMQTTPGFEICTTAYYMITIMCVFGGCGFDSYFLESCFYLSGHFRIIYRRFRSVKYATEAKDDRKFQSQISTIVNYHNEILNACADLQDIVRSAIFPFLLFDSVVICTCVYTLLAMPNLIVTIAFMGITIAAVAQIFVLTYSGQVLINKSQDLTNSIYDSEWYIASPGQRRLLILCMMRARKGFTFKMGIFQLALPTFSAILQGAGSYIALLSRRRDVQLVLLVDERHEQHQAQDNEYEEGDNEEKYPLAASPLHRARPILLPYHSGMAREITSKGQ
ncbi:odorant receptor 82a-like [Phlebotomus argentipes]|uniref:odorant receptor 82a-like n=1 Tax=Phlebotomus argentipes TaxID=94469 RepID=UPI00289376DF|nr:odorant receptor 82a-like [Phlebotomus argentipes]